MGRVNPNSHRNRPVQSKSRDHNLNCTIDCAAHSFLDTHAHKAPGQAAQAPFCATLPIKEIRAFFHHLSRSKYTEYVSSMTSESGHTTADVAVGRPDAGGGGRRNQAAGG